tara:strand:+ start:10 stop:723 length:714 start_codon:yes stop_codon:yes gene_type:complete
MSSEIKVDTISEKTSANGVTIDGVKLKDNAVETNTISEGTSGSGVTIDSVLVKDGVAHSGLVLLDTLTASDSASLISDNFVDDSLYNSYKVVCEYILPATNNTNMLVTFRQGGASGSDITGTYDGAKYRIGANTTSNNTNYSDQAGTNYIEMAFGLRNPATTALYSATYDFFMNTTSKGFPYFVGQIVVNSATNSGDTYFWHLTGMRYASDVATGLKFYMGSGNITSGKIYIYGVKK